MVEVTPTLFGILIAFVLPGLVLLYSLSQASDTARAQLLWVVNHQHSIVAAMLLLGASAIAGLLVSAIREFLFEYIPNELLKRRPSECRPDQDVLDYVYRYHQFRGGVFIASFPLVVQAAVDSTCLPHWLPILACAAWVWLGWATWDMLRSHERYMNMSASPKEEPGDEGKEGREA